jgi:hypothetical protein
VNVALWIASGLLAGLFLATGGAKLATPYDKLRKQQNMAWVDDFSAPAIKAIGTAEVLGAIGLVLPWVTNIAHVLTPVAAVGLVLVQAGAVATHLRRGEHKVLPLNVVLVLLAAFVAVGRFAGWGT